MTTPLVVRCYTVEQNYSSEYYFPEIECKVDIPSKDNYQTIDYTAAAFSIVSCGVGYYLKKPEMCLPMVKWFSDNARRIIDLFK